MAAILLVDINTDFLKILSILGAIGTFTVAAEKLARVTKWRILVCLAVIANLFRGHYALEKINISLWFICIRVKSPQKHITERSFQRLVKKFEMEKKLIYPVSLEPLTRHCFRFWSLDAYQLIVSYRALLLYTVQRSCPILFNICRPTLLSWFLLP